MAGGPVDDLTTEHGILITGKWQWTHSDSTGRWTSPQQGYRGTTPSDNGFGVRRSRIKMRGKGQSLVVRFESESGKDFQLLGWTIPFTAKTED